MEEYLGIAWAVQWLGLQISNPSVTGLIPSQETKIQQAAQHGSKRKKEKRKTQIINLKSGRIFEPQSSLLSWKSVLGKGEKTRPFVHSLAPVLWPR